MTEKPSPQTLRDAASYFEQKAFDRRRRLLELMEAARMPAAPTLSGYPSQGGYPAPGYQQPYSFSSPKHDNAIQGYLRLAEGLRQEAFELDLLPKR